MQRVQRALPSRWGFILASVGSAVGMANVWGFPHKMGSNGGGAFLLHLSAVRGDLQSVWACRRSLPWAAARARERWARMGSAWATRGKAAGKAGSVLGWLPLAGSLCIAIGYAVIVSYVLKALVDSVVGTLLHSRRRRPGSPPSPGRRYSVIPYHVIVVVGTLLTLFLGAHSIEKTNKVMMPLFFVIFLVLAVRVAFLPGAAGGLYSSCSRRVGRR